MRLLLRGIAYIGLCLLTAVMWLPMRYFGIVALVALPFEIEWIARAVQRSDLPQTALFIAILLGTIAGVAAMVMLRAWMLRTWDDMTGARWIWRW